MLDLPQEIYCEIVDPLTRSVENPRGRGSLVAVSGTSFLYDAFKDILDPSSSTIPDIVTLRNLRLVSKEFCLAATRALFFCAIASLQPGNRHRFPNINMFLYLIINSPSFSLPMTLLKNLRLDFMTRSRTKNVMFERLNQDLGLFHAATSPDGHELGMRSAFETFLGSLPTFLNKLENLRTLELLTPPLGCQMTRWSDEVLGFQLNLDICSVMTQSLASCFASIPFEHLTALRLILPGTRHFMTIEKAIPDSLLLQLKELHLGISDATGPGGSWEGDLYGNENLVPSNLQKIYHNTKFTSGLLNICSRARNLEILGISGTHLLPGDGLQWNPIFRGLKALYLNRLSLSPSTIAKLVSPHSDAKSQLTHIWFSAIELERGEWEEVFTNLSSLPHLSYFNAQNLLYSKTGTSSQHHFGNIMPWDQAQCIWTRREEDRTRLAALVRALIKKAGGPAHYPNSFGEQSAVPIEELHPETAAEASAPPTTGGSVFFVLDEDEDED